MRHFHKLILIAGIAVCLPGCESVTEGPTTPTATSSRTTRTTTVVEEPRQVDIATKPGSQDQNSLPHGQPDHP
jgi:hypothetical protein